MSDWQQILRESVVSVDELVDRFGAENVDRDAVERAIDRFNLRITPAALAQIRRPGDAFWNQYVPTGVENEIVDGIVDSLGEDADSPVPNITHRYPDRVLFLVSPVCATYCRFCTRRRKVGDPEKIPLNQFDAAFDYLRAHTEVRDVILSGGDPFMLSDRRIEFFLRTLREIPHIEIIRIHTRMPSHLPERITSELCDVVKRHHPVYVNVHFNHPDELTPAAVTALGRLADAGVPLGSQTVLLAGVNDDPAVMKELMRKLLQARVRPYYLYQADVVAGGEHFRTSVERGLEVVRGLRGWTSGLAVPHYVIDAPGGGGKIPLLPSYVERLGDREVVVRNYAGEVYRYPQAGAEPATAGCGGAVPAVPNRVAATVRAGARAPSGNGATNGNGREEGSGRQNGNGRKDRRGGSNGAGAASGHGVGPGGARRGTRAGRRGSTVVVAPLPSFPEGAPDPAR